MKLINICGLEGTGKSTATKAVKNYLNDLEIDSIQTREPGGTPIAEEIRALVKHFDTKEVFDPMTELLLFYAARTQLFIRRIIPAIKDRTAVIADRSWLCSYAYQVCAGGIISKEDFWAVHNTVMSGMPEYDLTIYLYTETVEEGLERARGRGELDRIEQNSIEFFQRAKMGYEEILNQQKNVLRINTTQFNESQVKDIVQNEIKKLFS